MFLTLRRVFPGGATEADLLRDLPAASGPAVHGGAPGRTAIARVLWTTFTPQQIDIDVRHPRRPAPTCRGILETLREPTASALDPPRRRGLRDQEGRHQLLHDCRETFAFHRRVAAQGRTSWASRCSSRCIPTTASRSKSARHVDWVYDFALPPLVLHACRTRRRAASGDWIGMRPTNALNRARHPRWHRRSSTSAPTRRIATRCRGCSCPAAHRPARRSAPPEQPRAEPRGHRRRGVEPRPVPGQLHLLRRAGPRRSGATCIARAIQFFLPGMPQVYYVGLLAGENDMALLARTGVGRDINRHHYTHGRDPGGRASGPWCRTCSS